jgi:hypothetical protein
MIAQHTAHVKGFRIYMARPPKEHKTVSIRLDAKLREKADAVRTETGETLTELIEDGLARAIKARQRKLRQARRG